MTRELVVGISMTKCGVVCLTKMALRKMASYNRNTFERGVTADNLSILISGIGPIVKNAMMICNDCKECSVQVLRL